MEKEIKEIEITCKVNEELSTIKSTLENKGFKYIEEITLSDIYMKNDKTNKFGPKEGKITDTLIIRYVNANDQKVICKKRNYNEKGVEISTEKSITKVLSIENAEKQLNSLGYTRYLNMIDKNYMYENEKYIIYIQDVEELGIFLEIELKNTENDTDSIEKLIDFVKSLNLKIGDKFDIRKAELLYKKQNSIK